jgi:hypothetical protein
MDLTYETSDIGAGQSAFLRLPHPVLLAIVRRTAPLHAAWRGANEFATANLFGGHVKLSTGNTR